MGHGKSTLFKSLCKQLKIKSGNIIIDENLISSFNNKQFAKKVGVLFQENISPNINVKQLVSYGRFSHISIFSNLNENDYEIINKALKITGTKQFENLNINELSSGSYPMSEELSLVDGFTGSVYDVNKTIKENRILNGSKIILM